MRTDTLDEVDRFTQVVMMLDVVESVRLMERDESGFIQRWRQFVRDARDNVLPASGGRIRKSLGDGLMLEFTDAGQAMQAALALLQVARDGDEAGRPDRRMQLRVAAHVTPYVADELDVYGAGVNLTARLVQLAGPGEIVVSDALQRQLDPARFALDDLGLRCLRHVSEPVQVFRVQLARDGSGGADSTLPGLATGRDTSEAAA
jgi:class 3 adenylate cyclase